MSKIAYIIRPITNGMYNDTYTVYYTNGARRRYTINGAMNKKHFEFIQSATVEAFYSKWTGAHKHDIFRPAPAEEPTAEEPTAEEPVAEEPAADQEPKEETAEEPAADQEPEEATAENFAPCFEIIKPHLFAKVEHVGENFPNRSECVYRLQGEDVALSIWIDAAFTTERLSRKFLDAWEAAGIVEERRIFEIAMENTMAQQKPRIHAGTMFYNPDSDSLSNSALLESCFNRQNLDKHSDILVTTSEQNNGAIALFYPPVCEKICELLHGAGFYVAFTSKNEGIVHKLDHLEVSAIRRNLQSTNRIFDPADTLTDEVFYYDPIIKRLIPESKTADFEVLRRQVLKGLA